MIREALWKACWVQEHGYETLGDGVGGPGDQKADAAFEFAVTEQRTFIREAERIGFAGDPAWAHAMAAGVRP
jgi:hypothetical protein